MNNFLSFLFFLVTTIALCQNNTKEIDGKSYIIHTVKPSETLFGLSRKYEISVEEIKKANPKLSESLDIEQEVLIPQKKNNYESLTGNEIYHTVAPGETLFAISRKYKSDAEDIKKWNGMTDNSIDIGAKLIVGMNKPTQPEEKKAITESTAKIHAVQPGETLYSISRMYNLSADKIKELNKLNSNELSIGQKLVVNPEADEPSAQVQEFDKTEKKEKVELVETAKPDKKEESEVFIPNSGDSDPEQTNLKPLKTDEFVEKIEKGVAELIPNTQDTRKYLALHRTIPVNTIIRVRNEITGKEIWARVVGKLPDTGENKDILIKISKAAYDKLGALDNKFRVVITYIP